MYNYSSRLNNKIGYRVKTGENYRQNKNKEQNKFF